ncbi:MAG: DUF1801 domain-containing protein [Anaerolineales bacterium]|nr:DUF1801 domain-containing protein [Anaerolineales bacterium]
MTNIGLAPGMNVSGHLLATKEIDQFLFQHPSALKEIVFELRSMVVCACPGVEERILWGGLSYHDPERGGPVKAGICQIEFHADQIHIAFLHGAFLPDPAGLLEGDRLAKRFLRLRDYDVVPWNEVEALIQSAAAFRPGIIES